MRKVFADKLYATERVASSPSKNSSDPAPKLYVERFMEYLQIHFPVAGIETIALVPPMAAFVISFFTSMAGISGAFLLLPIQVSVLGFTIACGQFDQFAIQRGGHTRRRPAAMPRRKAHRLAVGSQPSSPARVPGVLIGYFLRVKIVAGSARI